MIIFHDVDYLIAKVACVFFMGCYPPKNRKPPQFCVQCLFAPRRPVCWVSRGRMESLASYWQYKTEINLPHFPKGRGCQSTKKSVQTYTSLKFLNQLSLSQIHRNIKDLHFCPKSGWCFSRENEALQKNPWWFSAWQVPPPAFPEFKFCISGITQTIFLLGEINVTFICWKTSQDFHHHLFDFPVPAPEGSPGTSWGGGSWEFCLPYRIGKKPSGKSWRFFQKTG